MPESMIERCRRLRLAAMGALASKVARRETKGTGALCSLVERMGGTIKQLESRAAKAGQNVEYIVAPQSPEENRREIELMRQAGLIGPDVLPGGGPVSGRDLNRARIFSHMP